MTILRGKDILFNLSPTLQSYHLMCVYVPTYLLYHPTLVHSLNRSINQPSAQSPKNLLNSSPTHSLILLLIDSLILSFSQSLNHSFTHSLKHSLDHSITHSLNHSLNQSLSTALSLTHPFIRSLYRSTIHSLKHPINPPIANLSNY